MEVGDYITSKSYASKGKGCILNISEIAGSNTYTVFFESTKELLSLNEADVLKIKTPFEKIKDNDFDNPLLFPVRVLSEKIESLFYQDKIISACNFSIIPLPHQVLTVNNVLEKQFLPRCLIADEVGLGKTIEAALIFEELKFRKIVKRILIVAPSGLTRQWKEELETKFNEDFILMTKESFKSYQEVHGEENVWSNFNKVITSVDFLKPKPLYEELSQKEWDRRNWHNEFITNQCINSSWDMIIFDEAHNLSKSGEGTETARYKLGKGLAQVAPILLLLTATPHQGDSEKFKNLLKLIDPYKFYAKDSLTPENVSSVTIKNNKRAAVDFKGNLIFKKRIPQIINISQVEGDIEKQLYDKVTEYVSKYYDLAVREKNFPIMFLLIIYQRMVSSSSRAIFKSMQKRLHYLKTDYVSANNFKEIEIDEFENINPQEVYDELYEIDENELNEVSPSSIPPIMVEEINMLEQCVNLAQRASQGRQDFKMRKLLEVIDTVILEERNPKIKFIIFTEFIETQNYIRDVLEGMGYSTTLFNGSMSLDDKIKSKTRFKEECQFLITTDSGGEGINLQFCNIMINYDLPWNPMKIEQRIGRIDRIGQTKDVRIFNFILEGTVEERVHSILDSKLDLIAEEFGDDKRNDVLTALSDEHNFDKIYMGTITNEHNEKELERIGASIYDQAKKIIQNQDFLIPFTEPGNSREIQSHMLGNESTLIKNLVFSYAKLNNVGINEYTRKKDVFYFDDYIDGEKLKNIVFDRKIALENEEYNYLNVNHPFVQNIVNNSIKNDAMVFNIKYKGFNDNVKGFLFYYRFELTNNEGFVKRKLVPIFLNQEGIYDSKISNWFKDIKNLNFSMLNEPVNEDFKDLLSVANKIRDNEISDFKSEMEIKLLEQLNHEKEKFEKYFMDKEYAINKIAIDNIRNAQLQELMKTRQNEFESFSRKRNIVPKSDLFAIAKVELYKDPEKLV
jgi:SNF2 family DNA or RNA helicase